MSSVLLIKNTNTARRTYINQQASSAITNTTAETAFDIDYTFPSQSQQSVYVGTLIRLEMFGTINTGLLNLSFTFRVRWGGLGGVVLCTTSSIALASSLTDAGWQSNMTLMVRSLGAGGTLEAQAFGAFQSGALLSSTAFMPNTSAVAMDTTIPQPLVVTAQWGTANTNSIVLRSMVLDIDQP